MNNKFQHNFAPRKTINSQKEVMKKVIFTLTMVALATFSFSNNDEKNVSTETVTIAKAKGAIKSSCPNADGNLTASVKVLSACFVDGFVTEVTFYKTSPCPPNQICIQIVEVIGKVTLDCQNNVIDVTCGGSLVE